MLTPAGPSATLLSLRAAVYARRAGEHEALREVEAVWRAYLRGEVEAVALHGWLRNILQIEDDVSEV